MLDPKFSTGRQSAKNDSTLSPSLTSLETHPMGDILPTRQGSGVAANSERPPSKNNNGTRQTSKIRSPVVRL